MNKQKSMIKFLFIIVLISLIFGFGCSSGQDDANSSLPFGDDDDYFSPPGDDDSSPFDDDDDSQDDDDNVEEGEIRITKPTQGQTINGTIVEAEFIYGDSVTDLAVTLDQMDVSAFFTTSQGEGNGVISDVIKGNHTLVVSGNVEGKGTISDSVGFKTKIVGPYLELSLSDYNVSAGETVTATWVFYDEDLNDVTDQIGPQLFVDNGAQIQGSNNIYLPNTGDTTVRAEVIWKSVRYDDSKVVHVGDFDPPYISIENPQRGTFASGGSIYVAGLVTDFSPIKFLRIKSIKEPDTAWVDVPVDSHGNFSHLYYPVAGLNTIQLWASDDFDNESRGNVSLLNGLYHDDGQAIENSAALRINQQGFDSIVQVAQDAINAMDFVSLLPANPVVSGEFLLTTYEVNVIHNTLAIGPVSLALSSPVSGQIALTGSIGAIYMEVQITGDFFEIDTPKILPYSFTIPISATGADISGNLNLQISGGDLYATLSGLGVNIHGFNIGVFPGWLDFLNDVISDAILDFFLEDYIIDLVNEQGGPLIADAISELNNALNQQLEILGYDFGFELDFESLETVDNGITLLATVEVEAINPQGPPKDQPGSYKTYSTTPTMGQYVPDTTTTYGFGALLDDDLLNQALFEAYQSGLLSLRIDQYTAPDLGFTFNWRTSDMLIRLVLPPLQQIHTDAPLAIRLRPQIMPVLAISEGGVKDTSIESELQVGDFLVDLIVVDPIDGDQVAFTLALALYLPVTIGVDAVSNTISIEFPQQVPLEIQVIFEEVDFNDSAFEQFVPMLLEFIFPLLGGIIDDFPIPSFSGYTLQIDSLLTTGSQSDWMGLFGDLAAASKQ